MEKNLTTKENKNLNIMKRITDFQQKVVNHLDKHDNFLPKIKMEIIVTEEMAERVIETIAENASTGNIGDGKIFVTDLEEVIRIRTGESGNDAI